MLFFTGKYKRCFGSRVPKPAWRVEICKSRRTTNTTEVSLLNYLISFYHFPPIDINIYCFIILLNSQTVVRPTNWYSYWSDRSMMKNSSRINTIKPTLQQVPVGIETTFVKLVFTRYMSRRVQKVIWKQQNQTNPTIVMSSSSLPAARFSLHCLSVGFTSCTDKQWGRPKRSLLSAKLSYPQWSSFPLATI